jgi:hypothetical protein
MDGLLGGLAGALRDASIASNAATTSACVMVTGGVSRPRALLSAQRRT